VLLDEPSDALLELACRQVHCSFLFGTRPDHQKEISVLNNIGIRKNGAAARALGCNFGAYLSTGSWFVSFSSQALPPKEDSCSEQHQYKKNQCCCMSPKGNVGFCRSGNWLFLSVLAPSLFTKHQCLTRKTIAAERHHPSLLPHPLPLHCCTAALLHCCTTALLQWLH
jgi:hypothetical protein